MTQQTQAACFGCYLNPDWFPVSLYYEPLHQLSPGPTEKLTDGEKEVLIHLKLAFEAFNNLDKKHPSDNAEFTTALHELQKLIAIRVARRADPDVWFQPE